MFPASRAVSGEDSHQTCTYVSSDSVQSRGTTEVFSCRQLKSQICDLPLLSCKCSSESPIFESVSGNSWESGSPHVHKGLLHSLGATCSYRLTGRSPPDGA